MTLRKYIIGVAVVASTYVQCRNQAEAQRNVSGTSSQPTPTIPSGELGLGEIVTLTNVRIRVASQRRCSPPEPNTPKSGNQLWAAEVELTNTSNRPFFVNPFHLTFRDERKNDYVTSLIGCNPILESKSLAPGERIRGFVPFELPQFVQTGTLLYRPNPSSNGAEVARFFIEF